MLCIRTLRKTLSSCTVINYFHGRSLSNCQKTTAFSKNLPPLPLTIKSSRSYGILPEDTTHSTIKPMISPQLYEKISEETIENLADVFDKILEEKFTHEYDVSLSNGVLTVQLEKVGTYVINKQTPNRQIWLSSPTSGPKRFDYIDDKWVYLHESITLDSLLTEEFSHILGQSVNIVIHPLPNI